MDRPAHEPHVVVAGGGSAGLVAAIAAREAGARVTLVEKGTAEDIGGNAAFSGGLFLFAHDGAGDLQSVAALCAPGLEADGIAAAPYPERTYLADLERMSAGAADTALLGALVSDSLPTMRWLVEQEVRFQFASAYGSAVRDGTLHVPAGPAIEAVGLGAGLTHALLRRAERLGVEIRCESGLVSCHVTGGRVTGVTVAGAAAAEEVDCDAAVLAAGGFEADADLRARHLGSEWRDVKVRGTRHNTGGALLAALRVGAARAGDWSRCHTAAVDTTTRSPARSADPSPRHLRAFWLGVIVNRMGRRFVDEGADVWIHVYSRMGKAILGQPGNEAFQVFDAQTVRRAEELSGGPPDVSAGSPEELAHELGLPADELRRTLAGFNARAGAGPFDPDRLDGKATANLVPPKSNWALPLAEPPLSAYRATCGITFTHGGLRTDADGAVLSESGAPIAGLYAAGELVGGFFYGDYPGGSSLMRSAVFGRRAGRHAAEYALLA
jgi:tricarballylate dehydrogenase